MASFSLGGGYLTLKEYMCLECLLCQDYGLRVPFFKELWPEKEDTVSGWDHESPLPLGGKKQVGG